MVLKILFVKRDTLSLASFTKVCGMVSFYWDEISEVFGTFGFMVVDLYGVGIFIEFEFDLTVFDSALRIGRGTLSKFLNFYAI